MKTILIIIASVIFLFAIILYLGYYLQERRYKRLTKERDNLNLTTLHGKNRLKALNKQIDRLYGFVE